MSSMSSSLSAAFGHPQDAVGARAPPLDSEEESYCHNVFRFPCIASPIRTVCLSRSSPRSASRLMPPPFPILLLLLPFLPGKSCVFPLSLSLRVRPGSQALSRALEGRRRRLASSRRIGRHRYSLRSCLVLASPINVRSRSRYRLRPFAFAPAVAVANTPDSASPLSSSVTPARNPLRLRTHTDSAPYSAPRTSAAHHELVRHATLCNHTRAHRRISHKGLEQPQTSTQALSSPANITRSERSKRNSAQDISTIAQGSLKSTRRSDRPTPAPNTNPQQRVRQPRLDAEVDILEQTAPRSTPR
ncbi:hypothetical protein EDB84DRAFT_1570324 [Lactarius hengduanensis]|nr:hypothetical protein EDB84DRAFT_1570324 [Lactarius hengduanensis]